MTDNNGHENNINGFRKGVKPTLLTGIEGCAKKEEWQDRYV